MPTKPAIICTCGRARKAGVACLCGVGDAAKRRAYYDAKRGTAAERGYDSRWRASREGFLKKNPTCIRCGRPSTVVNHNPPHGGDMARFWLRSTWEAVCAPCHNGPIQSEERRASPRVENFRPITGDRPPPQIHNSMNISIFPIGDA